MATPKLKVSQMSQASTMKPVDILMIVQDGVNKKSTLTNLLKNLNSVDKIRVNSNQLAIDFSVASKNDASALFVDGSTDKVGIGIATPQSKFHVAGNGQFGSSSSDGIIVQSSESKVYTATNQSNSQVLALSPARAMSVIHCNTGVSGLFSLPSGSNAQIKSIAVEALDAGKTVTISATGKGFNTITLDTLGQSILVQYSTSSACWYVIGGVGYTLSTL